MKKKMFFLIAVVLMPFFGSQTVSAQTRESCLEYKKGRTIEEFTQIVLTGKDPFIRTKLWPAYAEMANKILKTSSSERVRNITINPDSVGMKWLMEHTKIYEHSYFKQSDYLNGVRIGDELKFMEIEGQESPWAGIEEEGIAPKDAMYGKTACFNPEKPKKELQAYLPPPSSSPVLGLTTKKEPDWSFITPRNIIEEKTKITGFETPAPTSTPTKEKKKFLKRPVVIVFGSAILTGAGVYGGIKLFGRDQPVHVEETPPNPRTMPSGIPAKK